MLSAAFCVRRPRAVRADGGVRAGTGAQTRVARCRRRVRRWARAPAATQRRRLARNACGAHQLSAQCSHLIHTRFCAVLSCPVVSWTRTTRRWTNRKYELYERPVSDFWLNVRALWVSNALHCTLLDGRQLNNWSHELLWVTLCYYYSYVTLRCASSSVVLRFRVYCTRNSYTGADATFCITACEPDQFTSLSLWLCRSHSFFISVKWVQYSTNYCIVLYSDYKLSIRRSCNSNYYYYVRTCPIIKYVFACCCRTRIIAALNLSNLLCFELFKATIQYNAIQCNANAVLQTLERKRTAVSCRVINALLSLISTTIERALTRTRDC